MSNKEILYKIQSIINRISQRDDIIIEESSNIGSIVEVDSIVVVQILVSVEIEFEIEIPDEYIQIDNILVVENLINIIQELINQKSRV